MIYLVIDNSYYCEEESASTIIYASHDKEKADNFRDQHHRKEFALLESRLARLEELKDLAPYVDEPTDEQQDEIFDLKHLLSFRYCETFVVEVDIEKEISKII